MVTIRSTTQVNAPIERCFRLSVSVDLQMAATGQRAIAGVTTGLLGPGDSVTSRGPGGKRQLLVEVWRPYSYFREIMQAGPFKAYEHEHHFATMNDGTRIRNEIRFTAPLGVFGRIFESLWLRRRVTRFVEQRNALIKRAAESGEWSQYLQGQPELDPRPYHSLSLASHDPRGRSQSNPASSSRQAIR